MTPNQVARAVVNDHRGGSAEPGEPQTQTHEAHKVERLRGRRSPCQEEQGVFCLDIHSCGRYDRATYA